MSDVSGLPGVLQALGQEIDQDLSRGNAERAAAVGKLAHTIMCTQGQQATAAQLPWLMQWGEQFYRWRMFDEGCEYWKGIYGVTQRLGYAQSSPQANQAIAISGAFSYLAGHMDGKPDTILALLGLGGQVLGEAHPLMKDVRTREASRAKSAAFGAAPPPPAGQSVWNMAPAPRPAPPPTDNTSEALSLWVTLSFLLIASADGKIDDREYATWKGLMQRMQLPDVWDKYGSQGLIDMLKRGKLQQLSVDFADLPNDVKIKMAGILSDLVMADGSADPREIADMKQILQWLGVDLSSLR